MLVALKQEAMEVIQTHKRASDFEVLLHVLHTNKSYFTKACWISNDK